MTVASDQSVLILDSDTSGQWPLIRVRRWWTDDPVQEVLKVPGWSSADAKYLDRVLVNVQVTPDGRYAIAFSEAVWKAKTDFLFHVPHGFVFRKPDAIVTVIDLKRWQVLKSMHTASIEEGGIEFARVVSNRWIAFDGWGAVSISKDGDFSRLNQLLSIPDLKVGPGCMSGAFAHVGLAPPEAVVRSTQMKNDAACSEVLKAVGVSSAEAFDALLLRGGGMEPIDMKLRDVRWVEDYSNRESHHPYNERQRLWDADGDADAHFRNWGGWPYDLIVGQNPPFESSTRLWYGLYGADERGLYELTRYDAEGKEQASQTERQLLCGDASFGNPKSACGCEVIDVSEPQRALLTYCRQQRGDFDGMVQKEWLSVFHSDDLSGVGFVALPKSGELLEALAVGGGGVYVVTLEHGDMLRVYAVPRRH
ncbi:MAG: hypothetical protein WB439_10320 [Acidobacteriaceae bacterium]